MKALIFKADENHLVIQIEDKETDKLLTYHVESVEIDRDVDAFIDRDNQSIIIY